MLPEVNGEIVTDLYYPQIFEGGRMLPILLTKDHELGGIAIQDTSAGRQYQVWTAEIIDYTDIVLSAPNTPPFIYYSGTNITEVSLTFDQNLRVALAFIEDGVTKLLWYDTAVGEEVITELPGCHSPKISMDDKRRGEEGNADILFFCVKDNAIYYRQQRDRFQVEYLFDDSRPIRRIQKIGMTSGFRFQVMGIC